VTNLKGDGFPSAQKVVELSRQPAASNRSGSIPIRIARDLDILRNSWAAAAAVKQYITDLLKSVSLAALLFSLVSLRLSYHDVSNIGCPPDALAQSSVLTFWALFRKASHVAS
jgi:hypothetical protein